MARRAWDEENTMEEGRLISDPIPSMEEGRRSWSCCNSPGLDAAIDSLGPTDGVSELNDAVDKLSPWSTLREASKYLQGASELKRLLGTLAEYKIKVSDAEAPMDKLAVICTMEQELSATHGLSETVVKLFARNLENHFNNYVPSPPTLLQFRDDLVSLGNNTFGTPFRVMDWANYQVNPETTLANLCRAGKTEEEVRMLTDAAEQKEFNRKVVTEFNAIELRFCLSCVGQKDGQRVSYSLGVFGNGIREAFDKGHFRWLSSDAVGCSQIGGLYDESKVALGWTQLGFTARALWNKNLLDRCTSTPHWDLEKYAKMGTVIMPVFIQQLTSLHTTFETKVKQVDFLKAKVLAATMSLFIAGVPIIEDFIRGLYDKEVS